MTERGLTYDQLNANARTDAKAAEVLSVAAFNNPSLRFSVLGNKCDPSVLFGTGGDQDESGGVVVRTVQGILIDINDKAGSGFVGQVISDALRMVTSGEWSEALNGDGPEVVAMLQRLSDPLQLCDILQVHERHMDSVRQYRE